MLKKVKIATEIYKAFFRTVSRPKQFYREILPSIFLWEDLPDLDRWKGPVENSTRWLARLVVRCVAERQSHSRKPSSAQWWYVMSLLSVWRGSKRITCTDPLQGISLIMLKAGVSAVFLRPPYLAGSGFCLYLASNLSSLFYLCRRVKHLVIDCVQALFLASLRCLPHISPWIVTVYPVPFQFRVNVV